MPECKEERIRREAERKRRVVGAAMGREAADLVLKNASYVNVFTGEVLTADIAVAEGLIAGVGSYFGREERDCTGKLVLPGFLDAHIHLESSLVAPAEFTRAVLPHGTTTVVTDPHEIANVLGADGIAYMLQATEGLPVDVRFIEMMPIGCGKMFKTVNHKQLLEEMMQAFPGMEREKDKEKRHGFGPAVYYRIPGFLGSIGLISAIHGKFCESCNRVRLTAQGMLKTCLCFEDGADLRAVLRDGEGKNLEEVMKTAIMKKPAAHCFEKPEKITEIHPMAAIGG